MGAWPRPPLRREDPRRRGAIRRGGGALSIAAALAMAGCSEGSAPTPPPGETTLDAAGATPPRAAASRKPPPPPIPLAFRDVAREAGLEATMITGDPAKPRIIDTTGAAPAWFDADGDGRLDLYVPCGSTLAALRGEAPPPGRHRLFRNRGDGTFEDVTEAAGLGSTRWGCSACAGDIDNDGDVDLYVANLGANLLYRNEGGGIFTEIASEAGVRCPAWTPGCTLADVDLDGDLDLYVTGYVAFDPASPGPPLARSIREIHVMMGPRGLPGLADRLFRNDGTGHFTDVSAEAGLDPEERLYGLTVVAFDMTGDGLVDILVANDHVPNLFYRGIAPGRFREEGLTSGLALNGLGQEESCMGLAVGDLTRDGLPDFLTTNFTGQKNTFYGSVEPGRWDDLSMRFEAAGSSYPLTGWGAGFFDLDRDGDLDLLIANGHTSPQVDTEVPRRSRYRQRILLYRNETPRGWREIGRSVFHGERFVASWRGASFADFDDDGDPDVALTPADGPLALLRNDTEPAGHWLRVVLEGVTANRSAYGAKVVLEVGGAKRTRWVLGSGSYLGQNDPRPLFGLGRVRGRAVHRILVTWPGGQTEAFVPSGIDRTIHLRQGGGVPRDEGVPAAGEEAAEEE